MLAQLQRILPAVLMCLAGCGGTHGSDDGGEPSPLCGPPTWEDWELLEGIEEVTEGQRGTGTGAMTCQQPTKSVTRVEVEAVLPAGATLGSDGAVQVLVFEYDPGVADSSALCANLACESTDGSDLNWRLDMPADRSDLGYYVTISVDDGNGDIHDGCDFHGVEFFDVVDGKVTVPLEFTNGAC